MHKPRASGVVAPELQQSGVNKQHQQQQQALLSLCLCCRPGLAQIRHSALYLHKTTEQGTVRVCAEVRTASVCSIWWAGFIFLIACHLWGKKNWNLCHPHPFTSALLASFSHSFSTGSVSLWVTGMQHWGAVIPVQFSPRPLEDFRNMRQDPEVPIPASHTHTIMHKDTQKEQSHPSSSIALSPALTPHLNSKVRLFISLPHPIKATLYKRMKAATLPAAEGSEPRLRQLYQTHRRPSGPSDGGNQPIMHPAATHALTASAVRSCQTQETLLLPDRRYCTWRQEVEVKV